MAAGKAPALRYFPEAAPRPLEAAWGAPRNPPSGGLTGSRALTRGNGSQSRAVTESQGSGT